MARLRTTTYEGAVKLLGDRHERVTIGNNTTIESDWFTTDEHGVNERIVIVRLHGHAIVRLSADGVAVRDCGYVTTTTYDRINAFLLPGYRAGYKQGRGFVRNAGTGNREAVESDAWLWIGDV